VNWLKSYARSLGEGEARQEEDPLMDQTKVIEGYVRLKALRKNLPEKVEAVQQRWVGEFDDLVTLLQNLSDTDLSGFRVPPAAIKTNDPKIGIYYDRGFVVAKMDALLGFFEITTSGEQKPDIRFRPH
jgi:hypothetical protein